MRREAVADRIVTYCDALVAFSLVNGLAFLVALGETDIRCSISGIAVPVIAINVAIPFISTFLLVWLRRSERRLRDEETVDEEVVAFWKVIGVVRFILVWLFAGVVLLGIWAATHDPSCLASVD